MLDIILYAFGIMYSPGPANILALFSGVNGQGRRAFSYCLGVGLAMFILFLLISYLGSRMIPEAFQRWIAIVGAIYIAYLASKIMLASFSLILPKEKETRVSFKTGLILQLCNPKSLVAIVPIVTVQFPRAGIEGNQMVLWSLMLAVIACGAPSVYLLVGSYVKQSSINPNSMIWINRIMALLLFFIAYRFLFP